PHGSGRQDQRRDGAARHSPSNLERKDGAARDQSATFPERRDTAARGSEFAGSRQDATVNLRIEAGMKTMSDAINFRLGLSRRIQAMIALAIAVIAAAGAWSLVATRAKGTD